MTQFTNFVARYPESDLAPAAQWWVGDFYSRQSDFLAAEKSYKLLFQTWPNSKLAYEARLAAGRAALGRAGYSDAINHFTNLTSDVNCPANLKVQAKFAYGGALMLLGPGETNKNANLQLAIQVFGTIPQDNPGPERSALALGQQGQCYLQLAAQDDRYYSNSITAFQQATNLAVQGQVAYSAAQVGIGLVLEKMAALKTGDDQKSDQQRLLQQALSNYLDVFYDRQADLFWVKEAGLKALPLMDRVGEGDRNRFIDHMEELLPFLKSSLEKKRITQTVEKN